MSKPSSAQNQHYVPKFTLRNFLSNPKKEQVCVFSKSSGKGFTTSIKNVMAERRFYEFRIEENFLVSFEEAVCRVEDILIPVYKNIIEDRCLDGTSAQKDNLALLLAFQFLRTRSMRDQFADIEDNLAKHLEKQGDSIQDIDGYEPLTDDLLREQHIRFMREAVGEFAEIISGKDFLLLEAPKKRRFYLSDNPVVLHNSQPHEGFFGNVGLACKGIEIYMPLSSDLQLCVWCPSLLNDMRERYSESQRQLSKFLLSPALMDVADPNLLMEKFGELSRLQEKIGETLRRVAAGVPLDASNENMDFHNSLQVRNAREHLICQKADFDLAKSFISKHPDSSGNKFSFA